MKINVSKSRTFADRHIGPDESEKQEMLREIGAGSLDELISQIIPSDIRLKEDLNLPVQMSESSYLRELRKIASGNKVYRSYIGMGYYNTVVPSVIQRNIFENPGWYTQYTPYQAEISQGRLEALLNFQTVVSDLTGLELANASLLDEGTAAAEAMIMLYNEKNKRAKDNPSNLFYVSDQCFPQTIDVIQTRAEALGIEVVVGDEKAFDFNERAFGVLVQYPGMDGAIEDYTAYCKKVHDAGSYVIMAADLLSLALLRSPSEMGADVAVGNTQRFGVPMGFGGPHAAYFATHEGFKRQIPGRIIGVSVDAEGNPAYRMALQTREQHIKREKATSNICTAQALLAIMAGMYAVYHGPEGLRKISHRVHSLARILHHELEGMGFEIVNKQYFDTILVNTGSISTKTIREMMEEGGINLRYISENSLSISLGESETEDDLNDLLYIFAKAAGKQFQPKNFREDYDLEVAVPQELLRSSHYLEHPVFNSHHSESEMMRYIKRLENKDLSLTTSMIPLGSCTMKLNAASELMPVSWPEFSNIHPFVPEDQVQGYLQIIEELENALAEITGFEATSLQPNSGAQGEYAGLMVIRAYHRDHDGAHRNVILIPSSAHGTNPASAVMAGMEVVVTPCDELGNIDIEALREKANEYKDSLAGIMVTYPSTHGVYETGIREICRIIHDNGGLVYMDGANMNAQVGLTSPANIGADVCHLNLHKTFAIPHGGGGPGMGPICVNKKLAPYLPGHPFVNVGGSKAIPAISAAPWGSASILLISYGYIKMLGKGGLKKASEYAILNANYLKSRLDDHYPILYTGKNGHVAHEFIVDFRQFKHSLGVEVEDIAKRLMDYGFHAPTVSFPVPGTLMVEPTESENKAELDRLADALISIRKEIAEIEEGTADKDDNVLKHAPHTQVAVISSAWARPYSREKAAYPVSWVQQGKFWPAVARINNTYGDRNLICTCPPLEAYEKPTELAKA